MSHVHIMPCRVMACRVGISCYSFETAEARKERVFLRSQLPATRSTQVTHFGLGLLLGTLQGIAQDARSIIFPVLQTAHPKRLVKNALPVCWSYPGPKRVNDFDSR